MSVLILGGTGEARTLATLLTDAGVEVTSSLAGRVSNPALPVGEVRTGGFGGPSGLARYLSETGFDAVVDATHPFADQMTRNAVEGCTIAAVPLLRLERASWRDHQHSSDWHWVGSHHAACEVGARIGQHPFLSTGRQNLHHYLPWRQRPVLIRLVEPPEWELPAAWQVLRSRGPYTYQGEHELLSQRGIDLLITKDSGGALTEPKLRAAHALAVPVLVIARPTPPAGLQVVHDPQQACDWVLQRGK